MTTTKRHRVESGFYDNPRETTLLIDDETGLGIVQVDYWCRGVMAPGDGECYRPHHCYLDAQDARAALEAWDNPTPVNDHGLTAWEHWLYHHNNTWHARYIEPERALEIHPGR